jgi:hypothetical protein
MILDELCRFFNLPAVRPDVAEPAATPTAVRLTNVVKSYNPLIDDKNLRTNPDSFEALRNHYALRHEV